MTHPSRQEGFSSRLARLYLSVTLATATLATLGVGEAFAAYVGSCPTGGDNNYHAYVIKTSLSATRGQATVAYLRSVTQCQPLLLSVGKSFALPVNIQVSSSSGPIVQLGWVQAAFESANTFRYTASDASGGNMVTSTAFPAPVVGHSYTFIISAASCSGSNGWTYQIKDNTLGVTYGTCGSRSVTTLPWMWSGFEVYNGNDQFGGPGTDTNISDINWTSGGTTTYMTTTTISEAHGTQESYWVRSATHDPDGNTIVHGRTTNH